MFQLYYTQYVEAMNSIPCTKAATNVEIKKIISYCHILEDITK